MENDVIDDAIFSRLIDDVGEDMLVTLVEVFKEETGARLDELLSLTHDIDHQKVAENCHSLKSSAAIYGALNLQKSAEELEVFAKARETEKVKEKLPVLIINLENAIAAIHHKCA